MTRRFLLVSDERAKAAAKRYVRHFLDPGVTLEDKALLPDVHWEPAQRYQCFGLAPEPQGPADRFDLKRYTGVYYWGLYDHILIQDLFSIPAAGSEHLSSLPLAVAHHLVYRRGQFQAPRPRTVRPIILDPRLLAVSGLATRPPDEQQLASALPGSLRLDRVRLCHEIDGAGFWADLFEEVLPPQGEKLELQPALPERAYDEIAGMMSETVKSGSVRLIMVDDRLEWLKFPYEALGGKDFESKKDTSTGFWLLRAGKGVPESPTLEWIPSFEELCRAVVKRRPDDRGLSVVVTDVLFGRGSDQNGLDLLRHVRSDDLARSPRNVVIAFTGYASPLVTAACHGVGADFVVQKSSGDAHGYSAEGRPSTPTKTPILEMFWSILWLRAASWFTSERLAQLRQELVIHPSAAMTDAAAKRALDQVVADIDAVFPPHDWLQCFRRLRQHVSELLFESGDFVHFWFSAQGGDTRELKRWRNRLGEELQQAGTRLLG
jgi:CheY-like chemotaxis protein